MKKKISKKFEVIIRIILTITVLFTGFGYSTVVLADNYSKGEVRNTINTIGSTTNAGDVELKKEVTKVEGEEGIYNVSLTAKGKDKITTTSSTADIYTVVVLDTSGSMKNEVCIDRPILICREWKDIKYPEAKKGTNDFANALLNKYQNAQIALITFSTNVSLARDFDNKNFDSVTYPSANGLTNLGAAIQEADDILAAKKRKNSSAKLYMVLLSDGYPEGETVNHTTAANHAKNVTGIEIFTIGYDTDDNTKELLQGVATDKNHYSDADGNDVAQKFTNIAGNITVTVPAGRNAIIKDTIAEGFSYVEGSGKNAIVNGKNISFDIGTITEKGKTVSFKIKIDKDLETNWYSTNDNASISYKNVNDEDDSKTISNSSEVYWIQQKYKYTINYYKDSKSHDNKLGDSITGSAPLNSIIEVNENKEKPSGYNLITENKDFRISNEEDKNIIDIIYTKKSDLSYTVEYYKDDIKISNDEENTVKNQIFNTQITENLIEKNKYKPLLGYTDGIIRTPMPYTIIDGENIIKVSYIKRTDMNYLVKYIDKDTKEEILDSEIRTDKKYLETYIENAKKAPYGYKLDDKSTKTVTIDSENIVVVFNYSKRDDFNYKINYLEEENEKVLLPQVTKTNKTYLEIYKETAVTIPGYNLKSDHEVEFQLNEDGMEITFFYEKKNDLSYTVNYYQDSLEGNLLKSEIFNNQIFQDKITEDNIDINKYRPELGYKDGIIVTKMPYTIIDEENVINIVYTKKDNLSYCVEYYYDGIIDSSKTDCFNNVTYKDIINSYTKKQPVGYEYIGDNIPLTIEDSTNNVIKVYYKKVIGNEVTPPKTGIKTIGYLSLMSSLSLLSLLFVLKKKKNNC